MILFFAAVPLSGSGSHVLDDYIAGIAEGDREALAGLYRETHTAVYGFALSLCANAHDAEDVLQDTYLQVSRAAASYQSQGKPMAWMLTIARNLALQRIRERERTVTMTPEDWQTQFADRVTFTSEDRLVLETVLSTLGEEDREIVMLHAAAGMKHREIASLLHLPLPTVLSKYNRALKKLREAMKEVM